MAAKLLRRQLGSCVAARRRLCTSTADTSIHRSPITAHLWQTRGDEGGVDSPSNSRIAVTYPFSTDSEIRERYANPWGFVSHGIVFEDLDALAGNVAFRHCSTANAADAPMLVTAAVDKIKLLRSITVGSDVEMIGKVIWTGRSSLIIRMTLQQQRGATESDNASADDDAEVCMEANFTFVARDAATKKAVGIAPFAPSTPREEVLFEQCERRYARLTWRRGMERAQHARDWARVAELRAALNPDDAAAQQREDERLTEEKASVAALLTEAQQALAMPALAAVDAGVVLMPVTRLENSLICQPQQRNTAGRVFGGFLLRRAYELAFACSYTFGGRRPIFRRVDEVTFHTPVDVGDVVRLRAHCLHTESGDGVESTVEVRVEAHVLRPERREVVLSNSFEYTFAFANRSGEIGSRTSHTLPRVLPTNEDEASTIVRAMHNSRSDE